MAGNKREMTDNLIGDAGIPQDVESEKALLALCLKDDEIIKKAASKISAEDFYDKRNKLVYMAVNELYVDRITSDIHTVTDRLERAGNLKASGGAAYLAEITDVFAIKSNADEYIRVIRDKSNKRKLIDQLQSVIDIAREGKSDNVDLIDSAIGKLSALREAPEGTGFQDIGSVLKESIQELFLISTGQKKVRAVKTGFSRLDYQLGGLRPGTLNIIAARPGMGKTAFAMNIAVNAAEMYGVSVCFFSLEMSNTEIVNRVLASKTGVSASKLNRANISSEDLGIITKAGQKITELPLYINACGGLSIVDMISACNDLKARNRLGLVIVDYLQLMKGSDRIGGGSRVNEISEISRGLKLLAKDMDVPVIALSQLSRSTEKRGMESGDHTPVLSDLRDSGSIEQDADSVLFIHRDDYYTKMSNEEKREEYSARIIVAKNRHGETGDIKVKWHGSRTLFTDDYEGRNDPQEPPESAFSRMTTPDAAASDYNFEEENVPPPFEDGVPMDNPENDAYFGDDIATEPPAFL